MKERPRTPSLCLGNHRRTTEASPSKATLSRNASMAPNCGQSMSNCYAPVLCQSVAEWPIGNWENAKLFYYWQLDCEVVLRSTSPLLLSIRPTVVSLSSSYTKTKNMAIENRMILFVQYRFTRRHFLLFSLDGKSVLMLLLLLL